MTITDHEVDKVRAEIAREWQRMQDRLLVEAARIEDRLAAIGRISKIGWRPQTRALRSSWIVCGRSLQATAMTPRSWLKLKTCALILPLPAPMCRCPPCRQCGGS